MQTARVTVLMTPERKADLEDRASRLGVSSGEYIRLAVDNYDPNEGEEAELLALVGEVNQLAPKMLKSLDEMSEQLQETHRKVDARLRDWGIRK